MVYFHKQRCGRGWKLLCSCLKTNNTVDSSNSGINECVILWKEKKGIDMKKRWIQKMRKLQKEKKAYFDDRLNSAKK